ncbi:MAG: hypothetical protein M2R45_03122 [Verrucomicrobia subdivision 3 bacterium]|nr:hypothetical protein [Limisphaerales bacterium]MCS1413190.1 hypothetical protein [Limisphaerales bacterium]
MNHSKIVDCISDLLGDKVIGWGRIFSVSCRAMGKRCLGIKIRAADR